mmetsp:Transcript_83896/g.237267  ORF Transcript_83896/g.237267 Transcript_83896/m.237267 type:complete len:254 (-) Transcript_83896:396-1157(-)
MFDTISCETKRYEEMVSFAATGLCFGFTVISIIFFGTLLPVRRLLMTRTKRSGVSPLVDYMAQKWKPKFWYMDPVDLVRRVVVTSGLVFAPEAQSAMLLSITLNLGYSMTIGNMRPFYCSSTNTVVSLCNSFVVLSALSLFVMNIRYAVEIPYLDETMSFVLFGINVAAVVFTVGVESADGVKNKAMLTAKVVASAALSTTSSSRSFELPSRKMFSLSESSRSFEIKAGPEATVIPEHADSEEEDDDEEKVTG